MEREELERPWLSYLQGGGTCVDAVCFVYTCRRLIDLYHCRYGSGWSVAGWLG